MSDLEGGVFSAASEEAAKLLDWLSERNVSPRAAASALLMTAAGLIVHAASDRAEFERVVADHQNIFASAANQFFDAKEAEAATKQ
jgi:hypothetical protein